MADDESLLDSFTRLMSLSPDVRIILVGLEAASGWCDRNLNSIKKQTFRQIGQKLDNLAEYLDESESISLI